MPTGAPRPPPWPPPPTWPVYARGTGFAHRTRAGILAAAERLGVDAVALPSE
ncbi:hypothetical protein ACL02O_15635 [Micromonospora sp. MS34]|uniref:hypothetical protein n=1 Tax=Micromonospora sp. MS34 TaxID=3385971 RepID=UPI0039A1F481